MTGTDQQAYRDAYAAQAKLAKARRETIHHVVWRDGQMTCQSAPTERASPPPEARPSSSRGLGQGSLL